MRIQYHLSHIKKDENQDFIVDLGYDFSFNLLDQTLHKSKHEIELTNKEKLMNYLDASIRGITVV